MAVDLQEQAHKLEEALRESKEYQAIKDAYDKVKANEESKKLFDEFRETQLKFQQMQMQGEQIEEDDLKKAQEQAQAIEKDENIAELMSAEQQMSQVFQEINQIIVKPLDEVYAEEEK
ncbi:YlbF/YmcA family competence regulator [Staphylococcus simulans]|uniref:YlbF/YmcA family competence regulator n=1 Tax=Staphylococcus simulans TaxID=1286 RepID=UPI000D03FA9E|nr:YlbF/YmcA family competence regulator [Staphylococcus simulans]MCD8914790.1 YlbF/YmcA family competence regulator [Staphylococcus simulans]